MTAAGERRAGDVKTAGWELFYSGKVRDLYRSAARPGEVLMVASDRVSAFDHVLEPGIPGKGELLTRLSLWWFDRLDGVPNHLVSDHDVAGGAASLIPDAVAGRAMLVRTLEMFPIECVVRGYLAGSAWAEYQASGSVCGIALPAGLSFGDRLPHPVFTPAFKAPMGEHDENITFERTVELVGADAAEALRALSLDIYSRAAAIAEQRGLILADTKFEFGADADGAITLADEVLTSDSSRYWDAAAWARGERRDSFDKQVVRDWLSANWDPSASSGSESSDAPGDSDAPPRLPDDVVALTAARYRELIERLTA
ncbi:phosphoribosylaminoimidazolesuccinocarboxamide synthase [Leifsonella bigeumensis]|uniref:phosphoribosylaminoimidazolesuccinocarboxamide synthase n=1 Tax=Leifsonella bigeumensis TaxID=433643 RepID=UPI003CD097AB